jgi:hypothetical protein
MKTTLFEIETRNISERIESHMKLLRQSENTGVSERVAIVSTLQQFIRDLETSRLNYIIHTQLMKDTPA